MIKEAQKPKILIVDDIPQNIRLLEMNLKPEGYNIIAAYSGQEALEKVAVEKPDLILLDIMMPGMDGYEVCKRLRQNRETRALPVVMITASEKDMDKKIEALDVGADDFITKPFDRYEVLARVRSLLRVKSLHDELVRAKNMLEEELDMAREVQQGFMPSEYPSIPGLDFSHRYFPTFAVGGDFFDVNELSPGVVEIFMSDVMGHGPQAAMITGVIKTLLTQLSSSLAGPDYLLSQINERFHSLMASGGLPIFVTAFCMIIDTVNNRCVYSNAGHPAPFLIQDRHSQAEELVIEPGPALGMISNTIYEISERELGSGDMLFFYTDGLSELMNRNRVQFGAAELQRAILHNTHLAPHAFIEAIMCAADAFAEGLVSSDDITLLAVSYNP
ncbi:PP2C family protein-serine/threonine phosphatase [Candidatus Poribacteria bacterium]